MKILQAAKKLGRQFEKLRPPQIKQSGRGKQPCGYCGQTDTQEEGKNCPAYGKNACNVRSSITSVLCPSLKGHRTVRKVTGKDVTSSHKRIESIRAA